MMKKIKGKKKKAKTETPDTDLDAIDGEESGGPKKGRPTTIDYVEFVKAWTNSSTVGEVAEAMGIKRNSASAIAARLRKAPGGGVNLKSFPRRGSQPIDVKHLNKIAAGKN